MKSAEPSPTRERVVLFLVALAYLAPIAGFRFFPGLDLPWHTAVIAIVEADDPARFLGYFDVEALSPTYLTFYWLGALLARLVGDAALAVEMLLALYVLLFLFSVHRLARAFDRGAALTLLAAPAVYSMTLEFGFAAQALSLPMAFLLWAELRGFATGRRDRWTAFRWIFLLMALTAVTHPFGALIAFAGGIIMLSDVPRERWRETVASVVAMAAGALPAVVGSASLDGVTRQDLAGMSLWEKIEFQEFTGPFESLLTAPMRLYGWLPEGVGYGLFLASVVALILLRLNARAAHMQEPRLCWLLLAALALAYLITPWTFSWPRFVYAAQPRLLPYVWVAVLLVTVPSGLSLSMVRRTAVIPAAALVAYVVLFLPLAREGADFSAVVAAVPERSRVLGLIEGDERPEREPRSPFRNFTSHVMAARGGYASYFPIGAFYTGPLSPLRSRSDAPPRPAQPQAGFPRSFRWELHAAGWDCIVIRDLDPGDRFDYFREHAAEVEEIAVRGRWRLYRLRAPR